MHIAGNVRHTPDFQHRNANSILAAIVSSRLDFLDFRPFFYDVEVEALTGCCHLQLGCRRCRPTNVVDDDDDDVNCNLQNASCRRARTERTKVCL